MHCCNCFLMPGSQPEETELCTGGCMERAGLFSPETAICGCGTAASASSRARLHSAVLGWVNSPCPGSSWGHPALHPAADPQTPTGSQQAEQMLSADQTSAFNRPVKTKGKLGSVFSCEVLLNSQFRPSFLYYTPKGVTEESLFQRSTVLWMWSENASLIPTPRMEAFGCLDSYFQFCLSKVAGNYFKCFIVQVAEQLTALTLSGS